MGQLNFLTNRDSGYKSVSGAGSYVISVAFAPNFLDVAFADGQVHASDSVYCEMAKTATGYDVTVTYSTHTKRKIKAVVAKLPVDPEQTINF